MHGVRWIRRRRIRRRRHGRRHGRRRGRQLVRPSTTAGSVGPLRTTAHDTWWDVRVLGCLGTSPILLRPRRIGKPGLDLRLQRIRLGFQLRVDGVRLYVQRTLRGCCLIFSSLLGSLLA